MQARRLVAAVALALAWSTAGGARPAGATDQVVSELELSPAELEARLWADPEAPARHLPVLAAALEAAGPELLARTQRRVAAVGRLRGQRLAAASDWSDHAVGSLLDLLLLDRQRLRDDSDFLERVLPIVEEGMPRNAPRELETRLLVELNRTPGFDFFASERVEWAWSRVERRSAPRRVELADAGELGLGSAEAPIELSVYALDTALFEAEEVAGLLDAVRALRPHRSLLLITDPPMRGALEKRLRAGLDASSGGVRFADSWGRPYSPWPRDPVTFLRRGDGGLLALLRPDRQRTREEDSLMGLEVIQALPEALDERLGRPLWAESPIPFHNGNILPTDEALWITLHTVEPHILERLGIDRVPVESFSEPAGVARYLAAARFAAAELGRLFGLPARFIHPLPETDAGPGVAAALASAMRRLGGGAGFDLDSLVTLLPAAEGGAAALVGDLDAGADLVAAANDAEVEELRATYDLSPPAPQLRAALAGGRRRARPAGLAPFLDLAATHLAAAGFAVHRIPLLLVPTPLLRHAGDYPDPDFVLGWNNVVTEVTGSQRRAEGFGSGLASGDRVARDLYAALGYRLELLPPLPESVRRNGGYRCASNHVRATR